MLLAASQLTSFSLIMPAHAQVQKCQDSQGKWHYGKNLRDICKNSADIKSVKERVKSGSTNQNESASDKELARLELKLLNETEYLKSDLKKVLTPYNSVEEVDVRFDRLKSNTDTEIEQKTEALEGLQQKQQALESGTATQGEQNTILLADIRLRIQSAETDLRQLNVKSSQIDQRRAKVILLFNQFKEKVKDAAS